MGQSIRERADTIGTFRYISVFLMETLARWVPTTQELEVKVLFGRHVWDFAQHADALGRRTHELRAALHYTLPPTKPYLHVLDTVSALEGSADRVAAVYDALIPELASRYERYLEETDRMLDEPSVRIIERNLADFPRLSRERLEFVAEAPALPPGDPKLAARIRTEAAGIASFVAVRAAQSPAASAVAG
ncbi:MAG: hypothetical protein ABJD11_03830 [Gemmatimonadota bacterium]